MDPILNIAITAARKAGSIISRGLDQLDRLEIYEKGDNDFTTHIDIAAERTIIQTIHENYPNHRIIAEESGSLNEHDFTWVIDPLDGTTNFMHGIPHFCVSIAVLEKNRPRYGVIYDPIRNETFTVTRGGGAFVNSRRMRVTSHHKISNALVATGFPLRNPEKLGGFLKTFEKIAREVRGIRRAGSAALDLAYVAAGRLDGFWECNLKQWDIAAGALMVQEAGGLVSDFEGGASHLESGNIVAANPKLLKLILQTIK